MYLYQYRYTVDATSFFCQYRQKMKIPARNLPATSLAALGPPPPAYQRLQEQLCQFPWVCQGTVVSRSLIRPSRGRKVKKGPYYLWTCKVQGQTTCVALSKAQHRLLSQAIQNNRRLQTHLARMHTLTLQTILKKIPGVQKRK